MASSSSKNISNSSSDDDGDQLRRGPWTLEEDTLLAHYIACHGEGRWNLLAKDAGLKRTGKSCRLRWLNYLKPDVKRGNLTPQEQLMILELHSKWGNRWSKIAQHLPGRTDNEIKNYWRTRVQKQARLLKIDASSAAFQDVIRCFWMPRLLQKIKESSSPALSQPLCSVSNQNLGSSQVVPYAGEVIQCSDSSKSSGFSSQLSQFSEIHGISNNITDSNLLAMSRGSGFVDNCSYDMGGMNLVTPTSQLQDFGNPVGNFDMTDDYNWFHNGLCDGLWNMEEL